MSDAENTAPQKALPTIQGRLKRGWEVAQLIIGAIVLLWLAVSAGQWAYRAFIDYPSHRAQVPRPKMVESLSVQLGWAFPGWESRCSYLAGDNTDVFIARDAFEAVPYPEREPAMRQICLVWASQVDATYWPVLRIRDIRTGDTLVSYSARWGRFWMAGAK